MTDEKSLSEIKILLVIPVYNNVRSLRDVVSRALLTGYDLLIVDDGCTDGSMESIRDISVNMVSHPVNMGKGVAIRSAAARADDMGYTHMITIDADGQHDPSEAVLFADKIKANPLSIIVGNRGFPDKDVPLSSRFGRANSNFWLKVSCGADLPDTQSGYRAYPVKALTQIKCTSSRYDYEIEILVRSAWAGLSLDYVNISVKYSEETRKGSHFDPLRDNLRCSAVFSRLAFRNFMPWPHKILFGETRIEKFNLIIASPFKFIKTLLLERISLNEIAFAVMLGIFLGVLPIIGMHCAAIVFCATRLRLNRLISLNISHICAPPFVPALCVEVGYFARNGEFLTVFNWETLGYQIFDRIIDYVAGAFIAAPVLALLAGSITYAAGMCFFVAKGILNLRSRDV